MPSLPTANSWSQRHLLSIFLFIVLVLLHLCKSHACSAPCWCSQSYPGAGEAGARGGLGAQEPEVWWKGNGMGHRESNWMGQGEMMVSPGKISLGSEDDSWRLGSHTGRGDVWQKYSVDVGEKDNTEIQSKWPHHLKAWPGLEDPVPGGLTHVVGKLTLVVAWRTYCILLCMMCTFLPKFLREK